MRHVFLILILSLAMSLMSQGKARLSFMQEDLDFKLSRHTFTVDGSYWFSNDSDDAIKQALFYPYPQDDFLGKSEFLKLELINPPSGQSVKKLSESDKGFWFEVTLPAKTIMECRIAYRQKLKANKAKYIIMTTKSWGKPLELAVFKLKVPRGLKITKLPLDNPSVKSTWFHTTYSWERKNFWPEADFIVEFE